MKFYLQFGVPDERARVFLDTRLHSGARELEVIEADDWKEAREKVVGKDVES